MYIQRVSAESIAVSGTSSTAKTIITVPETYIPVAGGIYNPAHYNLLMIRG